MAATERRPVLYTTVGGGFICHLRRRDTPVTPRRGAGEQRLLRRMDDDGVALRLLPAARGLHDHLAVVAGIGEALDEAGLLHPVEPGRYRAARQIHALG